MIISRDFIYTEDKKLLMIAKEMYKNNREKNIYDYIYKKNISTDEMGVWINIILRCNHYYYLYNNDYLKLFYVINLYNV